MTLSENPLGALLEIRERRSAAGAYPLWKSVLAGALLLMLVFPALGVAGQVMVRGWHTADVLETVREAGAVAYVLSLVLATFTVAVVLPWKRVAQDAGVLSSLRAGRGLVELLGTRTKAGEIVDGIAAHTTRSTLREVSKFVLPLTLGWLVLPFSSPSGLAVTALLALPVLAILVWASCYLAMAWELWVGGTETSLVSQLLGVGMFMLLCPLGGCLFFGVLGAFGLGEANLGLGVFWLAGWLAIYTALNCLVSRPLALLGLDRLPRLRERVEQAGRRMLYRNRNRWMRPWSDNPIVVRETCREAMRTPFGLPGWLALQVPALWTVPLTGGFLLAEGAPPAAVLIFLSLVVLMAQVAMASSRTMLAVVSEVEHSSFEVLQQSRLSAADFCDGWAIVGYRRRLLELAVLAPGAVALAVVGGVTPALPILWIPLTVAAIIFASWAGLWSSFARTRRQAQERLSGLLALTVVVASVMAGYTASTMSWPWGLLSGTATLLAASWGCRSVCLKELQRR